MRFLTAFSWNNCGNVTCTCFWRESFLLVHTVVWLINRKGKKSTHLGKSSGIRILGSLFCKLSLCHVFVIIQNVNINFYIEDNTQRSPYGGSLIVIDTMENVFKDLGEPFSNNRMKVQLSSAAATSTTSAEKNP